MNKISLKERLRKKKMNSSTVIALYMMPVREFFRAMYSMTGDEKYQPDSGVCIMGSFVSDFYDYDFCDLVEKIAQSDDSRCHLYMLHVLMEPFAKLYEMEEKKWKDSSHTL